MFSFGPAADNLVYVWPGITSLSRDIYSLPLAASQYSGLSVLCPNWIKSASNVTPILYISGTIVVQIGHPCNTIYCGGVMVVVNLQNDIVGWHLLEDFALYQKTFLYKLESYFWKIKEFLVLFLYREYKNCFVMRPLDMLL